MRSRGKPVEKRGGYTPTGNAPPPTVAPPRPNDAGSSAKPDFRVSGVVPGWPGCCRKPRGCRVVEGCAFLSHPWKRAMIFGDPTVRCQATRIHPETGAVEQCVLLNGHQGACQL